MGKNAIRWANDNCRFAQARPDAPGQLGMNFEDPGHPLPPDLKKRVAESIMNLIHDHATADVRNHHIDPGEPRTWDHPGYDPYVEDLDATISLRGNNILDMNDEARDMGFPDAGTAHRAFQQVMPLKVTVKATTNVGQEDGGSRWGPKARSIDFDLEVSGELTVTGLGPMRPDGTCEFLYMPEPVPVTDWQER